MTNAPAVSLSTIAFDLRKVPKPSTKKNLWWLSKKNVGNIGDMSSKAPRVTKMMPYGSITQEEYDTIIIDTPMDLIMDLFYKDSWNGTYTDTITMHIEGDATLGQILNTLHNIFANSSNKYTNHTMMGASKVDEHTMRINFD